MERLNFERSLLFNTLPAKKIQEQLATIQNGNDNSSIKIIKQQAINRYTESNIPLAYWHLSMDQHFVGDPKLKEIYQSYTQDIKQSYNQGRSICLAGAYGLGKTMAATNILKHACHVGYSCLYSDLTHIISILTQANPTDKLIAKRELDLVDFLVCDEVDQRFFNSEAALDLYGKSIENIFRTRHANKMPTILITNSPNLIETFQGNLKQSLGSLFSQLEMVYVMGKDYRKIDKGA